jgi:pimeloyl-ACP methyl ester carboxylesterase
MRSATHAIPLRSILPACAVMLGLAAALPAAAQVADAEREARWRSEIVPGLVVGDAVELKAGDRSFLGLYTEAAGAKTAAVLVHGSGMHPEFGIVGRLRMDLADRGISTLSIQMPVLAAGAPHTEYLPLMPQAAARIAAAAGWLRSRGMTDLVLIGHSLGARMANAYFEQPGPPAFRAFASLAIVGGDYEPAGLAQGKVPVLDLYAERDFDAVLADAPRRARTLASLPGSRQQRIDGTDHFFAAREPQVLEAVLAFLRR